MNSDFKDVMSKRTDEELIKIVTVDRDGYQPLAVEAAEQEIQNRNLDTTKIEQLKIELSAMIEEQLEMDANKVSPLTRFIHYIVDTSIWLIIVAIITNPLNTKDGFQLILFYIIYFASYIAYYTIMETKYQKTVAKFLTKTQVVNKDGNRPEVRDILRRTFSRLIPIDPISFLFTDSGFHDRLSDTTLIKDNNEQ